MEDNKRTEVMNALLEATESIKKVAESLTSDCINAETVKAFLLSADKGTVNSILKEVVLEDKSYAEELVQNYMVSTSGAEFADTFHDFLDIDYIVREYTDEEDRTQEWMRDNYQDALDYLCSEFGASDVAKDAIDNI